MPLPSNLQKISKSLYTKIFFFSLFSGAAVASYMVQSPEQKKPTAVKVLFSSTSGLTKIKPILKSATAINSVSNQLAVNSSDPAPKLALSTESKLALKARPLSKKNLTKTPLPKKTMSNPTVAKNIPTKGNLDKSTDAKTTTIKQTAPMAQNTAPAAKSASSKKPKSVVKSSKKMVLAISPSKKLTSKTSLGLYLTHGLAPGFFEKESTFRYSNALLRIGYKYNSKMNFSISESITEVNQPALTVTASDPTLAVSFSNLLKLKFLGSNLRGLAKVRPGVSKASQEAEKQGSTTMSVGTTKSLGKLIIGSSLSYSQNFYKWTFNSKGIRNIDSVLTAGSSTSLQFAKRLSLALRLSYSKISWYEGLASFTYANYARINLTTTKNSNLSAGISTSDSQLRTDGKNNNELALYQRSKTELFVSAGYAL